MADFQTVMAQAAGMCKSHNLCTNCPVGKTRTVNCRKFIFDHPDEFEEIVMKWAEEHPLVTNGAKFEEIFGKDLFKLCVEEPWGDVLKWLDEEYQEAKK